ncbi:MAG: DUF4265 domain-containing protein [Actinomycetales bacterium]
MQRLEIGWAFAVVKTVHVYVSLERDEDGYPPFDVEELDAIDLGGGEFRITSAPAFVYGLAPGDIVQGKKIAQDMRVWVVEVLRSSDNWLACIMPRDRYDIVDILEQFRLLGCDARVTQYGLVTVVIPARVAVTPIMKRLQDGQDATCKWYFDLGVAPPG